MKLLYHVIFYWNLNQKCETKFIIWKTERTVLLHILYCLRVLLISTFFWRWKTSVNSSCNIAWTPALHKGVSSSPNMAVLGRMNCCLKKGGIEGMEGLHLKWRKLKKFSLVCGLVGSILLKKINKQKDYFHSSNTDVVVLYYNIVTYVVENTYILVTLWNFFLLVKIKVLPVQSQ